MSKLFNYLFKKGKISADTIENDGLIKDNNSHRANQYRASGSVKISVHSSYPNKNKSKDYLKMN